MSISVLTRGNDIAAYSRRVQAKTKAVIAEDAKLTEADAKARSRVRTGQMREGWHAFNVSPYAYELSNAVPWTVFNEFGTIHMSAQPMLGPAMEAARVRLPKSLADAFKP